MTLSPPRLPRPSALHRILRRPPDPGITGPCSGRRQEGSLEGPVVVIVEALGNEAREDRGLDEAHVLLYANGVCRRKARSVGITPQDQQRGSILAVPRLLHLVVGRLLSMCRAPATGLKEFLMDHSPSSRGPLQGEPVPRSAFVTTRFSALHGGAFILQLGSRDIEVPGALSRRSRTNPFGLTLLAR